MVSGSRTGGNLAAGIDDEVRRMIQSIKEIVGNHSDVDIYAALKEVNMDADEAAQKLLNLDPFREVKRKRDKKKEETTFEGPVDTRKPSDNGVEEMKFRAQPGRIVRRGGYSRNTFPRNVVPRNAFHRNFSAGINKEFRVVRDNRSNMNADGELKHSTLQLPKSDIHKADASVHKDLAVGSDNHQPSKVQHPVRISNAPADAQHRQTKGAPPSGSRIKEPFEEKQTAHSASLESTNTVGVYSSSTDPVHVPSPDSRLSAVGAIRREVRVGGFGGKPSVNVVKDSSSRSGSLSGALLRKSGATQYRPFSPISKVDQLNQSTERESVMPNGMANRLNSQHGNRSNQYARTQQQAGYHPRAVTQNKEWKPKLSQKAGVNNPGVIGTPKKSSAPADKSVDLESEAVKLQDKLSCVNISEGQNVIIAEHIRVPDTDRCRLTFGSFVLEHESSSNSGPRFQEGGSSEEHKRESTTSLPVTAPDARTRTDGASAGTKPVDVLDDEGKDHGSRSPVSASSEQQLPEQNEVSRSQNLDEYAGLVTGNGPPYTTSESKQQQDHSELRNFSAYDPQTGYDLPYFRPTIDENARAQGLPSPQEHTLNMHMANNIPVSTIAMMQQQQQQQQAPMAQMYPQVHVSHFANLMPYRQILSPVYVPQMPMPGFSGNPAAYPHPSNGNSYLLMPGGSSHLAASGMKYGIQQFKPVPGGGPAGFGSFNNPNGYPVNSPGIVGNATALEDSSRLKFKDGSIYITNPQAETSEIWMQNPRDLSGLQSTPYYNVPGQAPHGAYISSHTAHPSFNAAAAAAQSSHMQFQGLFHPPQPGAMPSPHHMGPGLGGNVGVGVSPSTPAAQAGTFQQPQLGHLNWPTNF